MRFLPLVALLLACGPSYSGTFSGDLTLAFEWADGSTSGAQVLPGPRALLERDGKVTIPTGSACGDAEAVSYGDVAQLQRHPCGFATFTGGTLKLSEAGARRALTVSGWIDSPCNSGGTLRTCIQHLSGVLQSE